MNKEKKFDCIKGRYVLQVNWWPDYASFVSFTAGIRINQVHSKVLESTKSNHKDYDSYIQTLTPEIIYDYAYSYN